MKILEPERRAEPLLAAIRDTADPVRRAALFRPLGAVVRVKGGNSAAQDVAEAGLRDRSQAVRDAAVNCLAGWPDAGPALALLEFIEGAPTERQRATSFEAVVRMAVDVAEETIAAREKDADVRTRAARLAKGIVPAPKKGKKATAAK